MIRLLLLVAIATVAWYLYRRIKTGAGTPTNGNDATPPTTSDQHIVRRCDQCGVHVPESTGVRYQEQFFCCPEHLNENLRKR